MLLPRRQITRTNYAFIGNTCKFGIISIKYVIIQDIISVILQDIISVILQEPNFTFVLQTDLTTSGLVPASCNGKARLLFISWSQSLTGPLSLDLVKNERLNVTSYFNALKFNVQYTVFFVTALYGLKYIQENKL